MKDRFMKTECTFPAWQPSKPSVETEVNGWSVEVRPSSPGEMVTVSRVLDELKLSSIAIETEPSHEFQPEEIYVREQDLIVRYAQSASDLFALQLDWRLKPVTPPFLLEMEVWLSIQTQHLDTRPAIELRSQSTAPWNAVSHSNLSDHRTVLSTAPDKRTAGWISKTAAASTVWLVDPSDQPEFVEKQSETRCELRARLFGNFLEKGVIRRARCRFLVGPPEVALEDMRNVYNDLSNSCLPLTA